MESWSLNPIFGSLVTVLLTVLILLLVVLLVRPYRRLSKQRRLTLLALRIAVILVLLTAMLRPGRIVSETKHDLLILLS